MLLALLLLACGTDGPKDDTGRDDSGEARVEDADGDGLLSSVDCDDTDADVGLASTFYGDGDGDGYGVESVSVEACVAGDGFVANADDCDDGDARVSPGGTESCNEVDDDCDGSVDEDVTDLPDWYADTDGDGFGDVAIAVSACEAPLGHVTDATDCDDTDAGTFPGAVEICDELDQDCDATIDEDVPGASTWYPDADGDGFGDSTLPVARCTQPTAHTAVGDDCDDTDASRAPGTEEVCDAVDQDCDGVADDDAIDGATWYMDADGDGYGDDASPVRACDPPTDTIATGGDCDNTDASSHLGEPWYRDADEDGHGAAGDIAFGCTAPVGYVGDDTDCDDTDAALAAECATSCDTPTWYVGDVYATGFGTAASLASFCGSYNAIDGDLTVDRTDLTDLSALSCLCEVTGSVTLSSNTTLETLAGLDDLTTIGGTFALSGSTLVRDLTGLGALTDLGTLTLTSTSLTSLDGIENLTAVARNLSLTANRSLVSVGGLAGLTTVGGQLYLYDNPLVPTLSGMDGLTEVGSAVTLTRMDGLSDLEGLGGLRSVTSGMTITENDALASLAGLDSLTTVTRTLTLATNPLFSSLDGLEGLTTLGGLSYTGSGTVALDMSALSGLAEIGDVSIYDPSATWDYAGLEGLTRIDGAFYQRTASDSTFEGLRYVTEITGNMRIYGTESYTGFDTLTTIGGDIDALEHEFLGLESVTTIGGTLTCSAPGTCAGLDSLETVGDLYINASDPTGLPRLTEVTGTLTFARPTNFTGLAALRTVGGDVAVGTSTGGSTLTEISGLNALETIGGALSFSYIDELRYIDGLTSLQSVGGEVGFSGNELAGMPGLSALESCGGLWISNTELRDLDNFASLTTIDGDLQIYSNYYLATVTGLHNVTAVTGIFNLSVNAEITPAEAEALRDAIGVENITGTVTIIE
jgi:hypothetical protein